MIVESLKAEGTTCEKEGFDTGKGLACSRNRKESHGAGRQWVRGQGA